MEVTVNGEEIKMSIGDKLWYISFGECEHEEYGRPVARVASTIDKIVIDKNGVSYLDCDDYPVYPEGDNTFFSKEDAEKWIAENVPEKYAYKPHQELFVIRNNKIVLIYADRDGLEIADNKLVYRFSDAFYNGYFVVGEKIINNKKEYEIYETYEQAKKMIVCFGEGEK